MKTLPTVLGLLAGFVVVGSVGPWVIVGSVTVSGAGGDATVTLLLGGTALVLAIVGLIDRSRAANWATSGAGLVLFAAGAIGLWHWSRMVSQEHAAIINRSGAGALSASVEAALLDSIRIGWGLEMLTIAGLAAGVVLAISLMASALHPEHSRLAEKWEEEEEESDFNPPRRRPVRRRRRID